MIGFGTVGRQVDDADIARQAPIAIAQVEPRLIADDHMNGSGIGRREVFKIAPVPLQVDSGDLAEVRLSTGEFQRTAEGVPLLLDLAGDHRARPVQAPELSQHRVQTEARLVHDPNLRAGASHQVQ